MAVVAIKTERRCKLCQHAQRPAIDALLELRSNRGQDDAGATVNLEYVLRALAGWGVPNPTEENCKTHWRKHCQSVDDADAEAKAELDKHIHGARMDAFIRVFGSDWADRTPTPEQILEFQRTQYVFEMHGRIAADQPLGLTHDHVDKAINTQTRRSHEERADDLVKMLAQANGDALVALAQGQGEAPVDGEAIEDAEVVIPELEADNEAVRLADAEESAEFDRQVVLLREFGELESGEMAPDAAGAPGDE